MDTQSPHKSKFQVAEGLFQLAYKLKFFALKNKFPELNSDEIHLKTMASFQEAKKYEVR